MKWSYQNSVVTISHLMKQKKHAIKNSLRMSYNDWKLINRDVIQGSYNIRENVIILYLAYLLYCLWATYRTIRFYLILDPFPTNIPIRNKLSHRECFLCVL